MELALRDYLAGHVLRKAMLLFEDAMGPWVKAEVKAHFCVKLGIADGDDDRVAAEHEAALKAHDAKVATLVARQDELGQLVYTCPKEKKQAVAQERKSIDEQLKELYAAPTSSAPVPRWIEECRVFFGPTMKHHVNASNRWDVHTIVVVMRALLRDVFARHLPDHFHAKELLSGILRVMSMRATRAHRVAMVESDVLGALQQMASVMRQCQCDPSAIAAVSTLLDEAKALVQRAREENDGAVRAGPTLTADEANAQQMYTALTAWELHIELTMSLVTVGDGGALVDAHHGRLIYKNRTVVFGSDLEDRWTAVVQPLKAQFPVVAHARHWYFHNLPGVCNFADAFATMQSAATAIATAVTAAGHPPWHPPPVADTAVPITLRMQTPSVRMSVPVACVDEIVGRESTVERVTAALAPGARVLLHGLPGVGKDTVMAEVANRPEIQSLGGLQAWLQASSDVVLRRQLIELFATHRPRVVAGLDNDATAAIAAIKQWLASHSDWVLFVEDANLASTTLWDVLPSAAAAGGRVLVTSQEVGVAVKYAAFESRFELEPITTDDSIELLIKSNVFSKKAPSPPDGETEDELKQRCEKVGEAARFIAARYVPAPKSEKSKEQRRKTIEDKLFECTELDHPEMRTFLEDTLGNLPLTVAQVGHMLRADKRLSGVHDLIALFRQTADLTVVDRLGANPMLDKHYYGLALSVRITLDRLRSADDVPAVDREGALTLLAILSLLDRAQTPASLLCGHTPRDDQTLFQLFLEGGVDPELASIAVQPIHQLLSNTDALERARALCVRQGLLQEAGESGKSTIGVVHQLMQRCLRQELVTTSNAGAVVYIAVRTVLLSRFVYSTDTPPSQWPAMRCLVPCVEAWVGNLRMDLEDVSTSNDALSPVAVDCDLLQRWGLMLSADGDAAAAAHVCTKALDLRRRLCGQDHQDVALSMSNLAGAYFDLGRRKDALTMYEDALALRKRVLKPDHPDIAQSMHNVASILSALGRHREALELKVETLKFDRRVRKPNDPEIATSMAQLAQEYFLLSRFKKAFALEVKVLALRVRVLERDHPAIAKAMNSLAMTRSALGEYEQAAKLQKAALEMNKRVLGEDHPEIAELMTGLATTLFKLEKYKEAAEIQLEALAMQRRKLHAHHSNIVNSMNNLAVIYGAMGRHSEALELMKQVVEVDQQRLEPDDPDIGISMGNLAAALGQVGLHKESVDMQEKAVAHLQRCLPQGYHADIAYLMHLLAVAYIRVKRHDDACKKLAEALDIQLHLLPRGHPTLVSWIHELRELRKKIATLRP